MCPRLLQHCLLLVTSAFPPLSPAAEPQSLPSRKIHIFVMTYYREGGKKTQLFLCNYDNTLILSEKLPAELRDTGVASNLLIWRTQSSDPVYLCSSSVALQRPSPSRLHTAKHAFPVSFLRLIVSRSAEFRGSFCDLQPQQIYMSRTGVNVFFNTATQ